MAEPVHRAPGSAVFVRFFFSPQSINSALIFKTKLSEPSAGGAGISHSIFFPGALANGNFMDPGNFPATPCQGLYLPEKRVQSCILNRKWSAEIACAGFYREHASIIYRNGSFFTTGILPIIPKICQTPPPQSPREEMFIEKGPLPRALNSPGVTMRGFPDYPGSMDLPIPNCWGMTVVLSPRRRQGGYGGASRQNC